MVSTRVNISNLYDYVYKRLADKSLLDIYKKLIDIGDEDRFAFLRVCIETLLRIDKIERYLRVLCPIGTTSKAEMGEKEVDNEKLLYLLRNGEVKEFNGYVNGGIIHLPFENLARCDIRKFHLKDTMLFMTDLSKADLTDADLFDANLTGADLFDANLTVADVTGAG